MFKYNMKDPLIFYRDKQIWLTLSFEVPDPVHVANQCLGIDLGLKEL